MVAFLRAWFLLELDIPSSGFPPGVGVDPNKNVFPRLVPRKNFSGPKVWIKG
jgi:hypothetical protein